MNNVTTLKLELLMLKKKYLRMVQNTPFEKPIESFTEIMAVKKDITRIEAILKHVI